MMERWTVNGNEVEKNEVCIGYAGSVVQQLHLVMCDSCVYIGIHHHKGC
jgi:hypothetical protein